MLQKIKISTNGERFYDITSTIKNTLTHKKITSGFALLFCPHTSCALSLAEAYDPLAKQDMENFLKHLAPRSLPFIQHKEEGPDDSPSHMKSILLQQSLTLMIEENELQLGRWQGIYLAEFRDGPHEREIWLQSYKG